MESNFYLNRSGFIALLTKLQSKIKASITKLQDNLESESQKITELIEKNKASIDQEIQDRENADNTLQSNIDSEASTRLTEDQKLQQAINKEVQDRKEAIEGLDVDTIGESGQYLKTISETDGKISATYGQVQANEVKNTSDKVQISSANNVQAALDALADVSTKQNVTAADKSVIVDQKVSGTTVKVNIKEGEENIILDPSNGLYTNILIRKLDTVSGENVLEEYELVSTKGTRLGQTIKVYKDRTLEDVEYTNEGKSGEPGQFLKFIYTLADGYQKVVYVDMSELVHESEYGDGLQVINHIISAKRDTNSEAFLSISEDGIKVSGVQTAINTAKNEVQSNLNEEINRATEAEKTLTDNLAAEYDRALSAEAKLQSNLTIEVNRAKEAEADLENQINTEKDRATTKENAIESALNSYKTSNDKALADEISRAKGAESTLQTNIDSTNSKVSELETKIGTESVANQIISVINALDATVGSTTAADGKHVAVQVVETDGKLTSLTVTEDDIASASTLSSHIGNTSNPHSVTKAQVGLGNVDNTSDTNKPISTATQTALNSKVDKTTTVNGHALSGNVTVTSSDVGLSNVTNDTQVKRSEMGVSNGVATLGSDGKVPESQLPSYVDDVLEYTNKTGFPATGESGKIYVDTTTNLTYRWSGSGYVEISPSIALGETSSTAYAGDKGKAVTDAFNTHNADNTRHITSSERTNWNTAYNWGNHADGGYLKSTDAGNTYVKKSGDTMTGDLSISKGVDTYNEVRLGTKDNGVQAVFSSSSINGKRCPAMSLRIDDENKAFLGILNDGTPFYSKNTSTTYKLAYADGNVVSNLNAEMVDGYKPLTANISDGEDFYTYLQKYGKSLIVSVPTEAHIGDIPVNGVVLNVFASYNRVFRLMSNRGTGRLLFQTSNGQGTAWGDVKNIAFIDDTVANADTVDGLHGNEMVRAYNTTSQYGSPGNIDDDYGQSFITFDSSIEGTKPVDAGNISVLNIGSIKRKKQLAFPFGADEIFYRRCNDGKWTDWKQLAFLDSKVKSAENADTVGGASREYFVNKVSDWKNTYLGYILYSQTDAQSLDGNPHGIIGGNQSTIIQCIPNNKDYSAQLAFGFQKPTLAWRNKFMGGEWSPWQKINAGDADTIGGLHPSDFSRVVQGVIQESTASGTKYILIGTLPKTSTSTYDAIAIRGTIGGWKGVDHSVVDISVGRRDGVAFKGFISDYDPYYFDIGVNDAGQVFIITNSQYAMYNLELHAIQATIDWDGSKSTPIDTNFTLLSNSPYVNRFSSNTFLGSVKKTVNKRTTSGAISIDGATYDVEVITLNGNVSGITLSSMPEVGQDVSCLLYGNGTERTVVIANNATYKTPTGENIEITVPANGYAEINFFYDGQQIWVRGV